MPRRVVATIGLFGLASSAGAGIRGLGYRANKARRAVALADLRSGAIDPVAYGNGALAQLGER